RGWAISRVIVVRSPDDERGSWLREPQPGEERLPRLDERQIRFAVAVESRTSDRVNLHLHQRRVGEEILARLLAPSEAAIEQLLAGYQLPCASRLDLGAVRGKPDGGEHCQP